MKLKDQFIECEAVAIGRASMAHRLDGHVVVTDEPAGRGGTDLGPPPFNAHFAMLAGCMYATMSLILADREVRFDRTRIHLRAAIDPRGVFGIARDVLPISLVEKTVEIEADIAEAALIEIREELSWRCMVSQLLRRAGVRSQETWSLNGAALPAAKAA